MLIGSRQRLKDIQTDPKITLGDTEVNRVSEKKTLGIVVDDQLLWRNHVDTAIAMQGFKRNWYDKKNEVLRTKIYFNACLQCPNNALF